MWVLRRVSVTLLVDVKEAHEREPQPARSLDGFFGFAGTEVQFAEALATSRWPQGFVCPPCGATTHIRLHAGGREDWQWAQCRAQTLLTCGRPFKCYGLSLTKRFQALDLVTRNQNELSALSLKPHLGVCSRNA
jgi:hypothetical protein